MIGRSRKAPRLFKLELRVPPEHADVVAAFLVNRGLGGAVVEELPRETRLACYGENRAVLARVARSAERELDEGGISVEVRLGNASRTLGGWRTNWVRDLKAVQISPTLWLVPTTAEEPDTSASVVRLEPALTFGFGEHPTTRMAALEVEKRCRDGAQRVLDFGTGSGVLAIVAAVSGAARATGLDTDPAAVAAARANAARNGVSKKCRFSESSIERLRSKFDVIVANVDSMTLFGLPGVLGERLAPGGTLLMTGFLAEDARDIARIYKALGFRASGRREESGWVLLVFRKR